MELAEFTERSTQLRILIEQAREAEAKAYGDLKGIQGDMLQCITQNEFDKLQLLENRYNDVEDRWRGCSLYTAELRAEMQDLIKERHADTATGSTVAHHGATARLTHASTSRGVAMSLDKMKPARLMADEVSPHRRPLIAAAFPDVAPRYTQYGKLPIGDAQIRVEFERLMKAQQGAEAEDGCLPLGVVAKYFDGHERLGVPTDPLRWVSDQLGKFKPALRRGSRATLLPSDVPVSYDEFAYLCVRWAQQ
jgi:hypothetical protein